MMPVAQPLIDELQQALAKMPNAKQSAILSRVTDLFLHGAATFSDAHVTLFDHVIGCLIEKIDLSSLIELSDRLATVDNAPPGVISRLAHHTDIEVAGPILEKSNVVTEDTLVKVTMGTKNPHHLSAIASRPQIGESLADALVERGTADIALKIVRNESIRLSELGFAKVINRAGSDKALAAAAASRKDLPAELQPFLTLALG